MSLLVDTEGFVALSPALLELFECRLHAFWHLQHTQPAPSLPAIVERAAHLVLFELPRQGWPSDYQLILPILANQALGQEWSRFALPEEIFQSERSRLLEMLTRFLATWTPPTDERVFVDLLCTGEDQRERIREQCYLDLVTAPLGRPGTIQVIDFRRSLPSSQSLGVDMAVELQAVMAIRQLRPPSLVNVRWVSLETGEQRDMLPGRSPKAYAETHQVAADIRQGNWRAIPCRFCPICPVEGCHYRPDLVEAREFALTTLQEHGLDSWPDLAQLGAQ